VDDVGGVATAKDARPPRPRGATVVDGCEFFLARRRRAGDGTGGVDRGDGDDRGGSDDADDDRVAGGKADGREEDGADLRRFPPPPGNIPPYYDRPEPLPRRQMRALRDGDRILVRYRCRSPPPAGRPRAPPLADGVVRGGGGGGGGGGRGGCFCKTNRFTPPPPPPPRGPPPPPPPPPGRRGGGGGGGGGRRRAG
jgi:hypothetical protein